MVEQTVIMLCGGNTEEKGLMKIVMCIVSPRESRLEYVCVGVEVCGACSVFVYM